MQLASVPKLLTCSEPNLRDSSPAYTRLFSLIEQAKEKDDGCFELIG